MNTANEGIESPNPLQAAIDILGEGGQTKLANAIGGKVKQAHVWYWLNTPGAKVPAEHCAAIEAAVGGKVTRQQLRPDVFGPASSEAA